MVEIYAICEKIQIAYSVGMYGQFSENADIKIEVSLHVECVVLITKNKG